MWISECVQAGGAFITKLERSWKGCGPVVFEIEVVGRLYIKRTGTVRGSLGRFCSELQR
jgi:hypothetical protein